MAGNQGDYKKYDHSEVIQRQLDRVNKLISTGLQDSEHSDFELYFHQIVMSLMSLDAMLKPFHDDKYGQPMDDFDAPRKKSEKLEFVRDAFREITELLEREDLFYVRRSGRVSA